VSSSTDFDSKINIGQRLFQHPSLDDQGYEPNDDFDEASQAYIRSSFANVKKPLYYCNGRIYKSLCGALRRAAIEYPESEIYTCELTPFTPHMNEKTRLPRVANSMSDFFCNMNSNDIYVSMKHYVKAVPTRNPFNSPAICIWAEIPDFFNVAITSSSANMEPLLREKIVLITKGYDMANACWAAQARCAEKIKTINDNPRLFWTVFESVIRERFVAYHPTHGMTDKMLNYTTWSKSLWFTLAKSTDASRAARKLRHQQHKRKREEEEQRLEEQSLEEQRFEEQLSEELQTDGLQNDI